MKTKKLWTTQTIISLICVCAILFSNSNASAISSDQVFSSQIQHVTDEVFDGYEGLETTVLGKVGFNYAIKTPDGDKEILLGFNPDMASHDSYYNSIYNIGTGWKIKIPYMELTEGKSYLHNADGHKYLIKSSENNDKYVIADYPSTYTLTKCSQDGEEFYLLEEAYGNQDFFSLAGNIVKRVDSFGNTTNYHYDNGYISKVVYSDGSSVQFDRANDRENSTISMQYCKNNDTTTFAILYLDVDSALGFKLSSIQYNDKNVHFEYVKPDNSTDLLLASYIFDNKYNRSIKYEIDPAKSGTNIFRIELLTTAYEDGDIESKQYFYNVQGRMEKLIDGNIAEVLYKYKQLNDGSITISTTKKYLDNTSVSSKTLNKYGQITNYVQNGSVLKLKYNEHNKVSDEIENNLSINYSYTKHGLVDTASFSDGNQINFSYYANGTLKKKKTNTQEIYYTPSGQIEKTESNSKVYIDNVNDVTNTTNSLQATSAGVSVLYNINSSVGVTNYHTYYALSQTGFNCYTHAIAKRTEVRNPGYYSGRGIDLNSLSGIKLNVEKDQESLGRGIYDTTVAASIPSHSWKIALKIRAGTDYHFMICSSSTSAWQFKAGIGGPVMQLLNGKTPSNTTWDMYMLESGRYVVDTPSYYNSSLYYMMILD